MSVPRVIFVNRFYWPDEPATSLLLTDLAEGLARAGWNVHVITSHPGGAVPAKELLNGVMIHRVRAPRGRSAIARIATSFTFVRRALAHVNLRGGAGSVVVPLTDPPLLAVAVQRHAARLGAQVVPWVQDIYPEVAMRVLHAPWLGLLRRRRDEAWRKCAALVAPAADMATFVRSRRVPAEKINVIPNWSPRTEEQVTMEGVAALRDAWGLTGRFAVFYSGNLGRVHELRVILDVATALREDSSIVFLLIGEGAQRAALQRRARWRKLANLFFLPPQPRESLATTLAAADAHFVTLRPGCEAYVFPSKVYGIAAAGRPLIYVGPEGSEVQRVIEREDMGRNFERHEVSSIAATLRRWRDQPEQPKTYGRAAAAFAARSGGADAAIRAWGTLLRRVLAPKTHPVVPTE